MDVPDSSWFDYTLATCAGRDNRSRRQTSNFIVGSLGGNYGVKLPDVIECNDIPDGRDMIPTPEITQHCTHLHDVHLLPVNDTARIQLPIGKDVPGVHIIQCQSTGPSNILFALISIRYSDWGGECSITCELPVQVISVSHKIECSLSCNRCSGLQVSPVFRT